MAGNVDELLVSYNTAWNALESAYEEAKAAAGVDSLPLAEQARLVALTVDLGIQLRKWETVLDAIRAKFTAPTPPSQEDIGTAIQACRDLAHAVANNILAEGRLNAVVDIIGVFTEFANRPRSAEATETGVASTESTHVTALARKLAREKTTTAWLERLRRVQLK